MKSIREEKRVTIARDAAEVRWERAMDSWEAITWVILHDETCGSALSESGNVRGYIFDGARSVNMPSLAVIYEITDEYIIVRDAEFYEAPYGQAGRA